jgi:hydrogenase nickel incorporation protein HypA/HybF
MHELSIMSYLLESVQEEAEKLGARRVLSIELVIGERMAVIDDSLLFCFDLLTPGTVAEGANVHVRRVGMRFHCEIHGDYARAGDDFQCPSCHRVGQLTDAGQELLVESMEIER